MRRGLIALIVTMTLSVSATRAAEFMYANDSLLVGDTLSSNCCTLEFVYSPILWSVGSYYLSWDNLAWTSLIDTDGEYGEHHPQSGVLDEGGGLYMQGDGNVVMYNSSWSPKWATNTDGNSGAYLALQDDTNLVVYSSSHTPLWSLW